MLEVCIKTQKQRGPENLGSRSALDFSKMLVKGIEPPTYALRVRRQIVLYGFIKFC
ncbi:hypothetical protein D3C77_383220 [compost metagenome]